MQVLNCLGRPGFFGSTGCSLADQHFCHIYEDYTYLRCPESTSIEIPLFRLHFIEFSKTLSYEVNLASQCSHLELLLLSKFWSDFN